MGFTDEEARKIQAWIDKQEKKPKVGKLGTIRFIGILITSIVITYIVWG